MGLCPPASNLSFGVLIYVPCNVHANLGIVGTLKMYTYLIPLHPMRVHTTDLRIYVSELEGDGVLVSKSMTVITEVRVPGDVLGGFGGKGEGSSDVKVQFSSVLSLIFPDHEPNSISKIHGCS